MRKKLAVLSAVALIGVGSLATAPDAEARWRGHRGGAVAAGVIGGLAAGALIGAASGAYAAPSYHHGYYPASYSYPAYSYGYAPAYYEDDYAPVYRRRVVRRHYAPVAYYHRPAYRTRRVVRSYSYAPVSYGHSWGRPAYYHGW